MTSLALVKGHHKSKMAPIGLKKREISCFYSKYMHCWFISNSLLSALDLDASIKPTRVKICSVVSEEIDAMWQTKLAINI